MTPLLGYLFAIVAYFLISLGFVLQKKTIGWMDKGRAKDARWFIEFGIWVLGLIVVNVSPFLNFFALQVVPAPIVSAISGLNIVFTVFLARFLLKDKLLTSDYLFSVLITVAIAGASLVDKSGQSNSGSFSLFWAWAAEIAPLLLLVIYFIGAATFRTKFGKIPRTVLLAFVSGSMAGYMITVMKILQLDKGQNLSWTYFASPYIYFYLAFGLLSFIAIQFAYRQGEIIVISPVQYGSMVFYPIVASYLVFRIIINPLQLVLFALIIVSVALIVRRHAN